MGFLAYCGRSFLASCIPLVALVVGVSLTSDAIQQAHITPPAVDGFAAMLLVLSMIFASRFYPQVNVVKVIFEGGFADANRALKLTFEITLLVVLLMSVPEGWRQYAAASQQAAAQSADSVFIGALCAAVWQFCNQLWYRLLFPGLLSVPIGAVFAVRALMKDGRKQRQNRVAETKSSSERPD